MEWSISKIEPPKLSEKIAGKLDKLDNEILKVYVSYNSLFDILDKDSMWEQEIKGSSSLENYFLKREWRTKLRSNIDFLDQLPADLEDGIFYVTLEEEVSFVRHITRLMLKEYLINMDDWIKRQEANLWDLGGFKDKVKERLEEIQEETESPKETESKSSMLPSTKDLEPEERMFLLKQINKCGDVRFPQHTKKVISALVSGETTTKGIKRLVGISDSTTVYSYAAPYIRAKWVNVQKEGRKNTYSINLDVIMADLGLKDFSEETRTEETKPKSL